MKKLHVLVLSSVVEQVRHAKSWDLVKDFVEKNFQVWSIKLDQSVVPTLLPWIDEQMETADFQQGANRGVQHPLHLHANYEYRGVCEVAVCLAADNSFPGCPSYQLHCCGGACQQSCGPQEKVGASKIPKTLLVVLLDLRYFLSSLDILNKDDNLHHVFSLPCKT